MSRLAGRLQVLPRAAIHRLRPRVRPVSPRSILIAHHLLTGDVCMLAPLLAKLRRQYPAARIAMTVRPPLVPLFAAQPYGVHAIAYDPRRASTLQAVFDPDGYDLAIVPGDNRYSWLAAAAGARWIVAFAGDRPAYKSWTVDEERPFASSPMAWPDMMATLVDGPVPPPYQPGDWPSPPAEPFDMPARAYAVLHVEASTPLKHWEDQKWLAVAKAVAAAGVAPVWSAGPQGEGYVRRIDPDQMFPALGHKLDFSQLWHLVSEAALVISPDTSVAHLAKLTFTPAVCLYGPSSAFLYGRGDFWQNAPFREVTIADFPCRDQDTLFKRRIQWLRRCQRSTAECAEPRCMQAIAVEQVLAAVSSLGIRAGERR